MQSKRIKDITASFMLIMESNMKLSGSSLTLDSIEKEWDDFFSRASSKGVKITEEEAYIIKNTIKTNFDVNLSSKAVHISDDKVTPWIKDAKSSIDWKFWDAYEQYLKTENIPRKSIIQISEEIDDILDLTGNPKDKSDSWKKRGLVMGNVQSGKTLNFTGLINKAVDVGYKYIILIGSINDNNLRMQTQERVDEGFTGFITSDLPKINRIGVGSSMIRNIPDVIPLTTSELKQDFTKAFANRQSGNESTAKKEVPFLFVVKKNTTVLKNIYNWFKEINELDPDNGKKMTSPVLFIDDEADWASPNTKNDDTNPTKINENIRKILTLFNKTNYIAYTATPFANIFINHETTSESLGDDLFPKDFILRLHLSENYKGQDFYFPRNEDNDRSFDPIIEITPGTDVDKFRPKKDGKIIRKVDINDPNRFRIVDLTDSLRDAIRCFVINNSIRALRNDKKEHNTMLINVTHRICLMNDISDCVSEYLEDLKNSIRLSSALPKEQRNKNSHIQDLSNTYYNHYNHLSESESFDDIVKEMNYCAQKIEVRSINSDKSGVSLDYKNYTDVGLSVIAVGGNKLSRGLTLEGLSVSYFDRTSKGSDTLTQMCRWFGYRPNYSDICKVFISHEYRTHYENISRIIDDLYQELEYMKSQRMTPKEYGIRVREHPDNITITAKNKMRNAKTATQSCDLWGQMTRHGMFRDDDRINSKNLVTTSEFISMLRSKYNSIKAENNTDIIFDEVDYDSVIKYITDMDIIPYGMIPKHAVCQFIERMKKEKCPPFKILLTNNKTIRNPGWYTKLTKPCDKLDIFEKNREITIADYKFKVGYRSMAHAGNFITYPRYQMGDPDDEKSLFKKSELDQIQDYYNTIEKEVKGKDTKKLYNKEYRKNKLRNFPALVFHTYNCFVESENNIEIPFSKPTIGFHLSFPDPENIVETAEERVRLRKDIKISYALNTVAQQQEIDFEEEFDESEDE
jgi:hypothetical protein